MGKSLWTLFNFDVLLRLTGSRGIHLLLGNVLLNTYFRRRKSWNVHLLIKVGGVDCLLSVLSLLEQDVDVEDVLLDVSTGWDGDFINIL